MIIEFIIDFMRESCVFTVHHEQNTKIYKNTTKKD